MNAWSDRAIYMFERRCLPLALLVMALAGCGSTGDGSVGIGSGQNPDPVAPDFAIAYTKGPLFDKDTGAIGRMPANANPPEMPFFTDAQIQPIIDWINRRCPNPGGPDARRARPRADSKRR